MRDRGRAIGSFRTASTVLVLAMAVEPAAAGASAEPRASLAGRVTDARTGTPLVGASVRLPGTQTPPATTDAEGRFSFVDLPAGRREIYVSLIGYILVRRTVELPGGRAVEVEIPLAEGTGTYSEEVTVQASPFGVREDATPSASRLGSADLQALRTVMMDDPLRAVQSLPGVATGDDLHSTFSVRGSRFGQMSFVVDGVPAGFLLHTVQGVEGSGSTALVNSDVLEDVTLLGGAYPQRFGGRTGSQVEFTLREGSRDRRQIRLAVSGSNAAAVVEGPLGTRRGSWLVSLRKSYTELLFKQIFDDESFTFGFADALGKVAWDASPTHQLQLGVLGGRSRFDEVPDESSVNEDALSIGTSGMGYLGWRYAPGPGFVATQRLYGQRSRFANENRDGVELDRGTADGLGYRVDLSVGGPRTQVQAGGHVQRSWGARRSTRFDFRMAVFDRREDFDAQADSASGYVHLRWAPAAGLTVTPGARVDWWGLIDRTTVSPWMQLEGGRGRFRVRLGAGLHQQPPGFEHVFGLRSGAGLDPERAVHADLGLEHRFSPGARWQVTVYDREDRGFLRHPDSELRRVDGRLAPESTTSRWANVLDGHARGVEVLVEGKRANGLAGLVSYSLGFNRYRDATTGERFWGDLDQRHTVNVHGRYRVSNRTSVGLKFRAGSGQPIVGYWEYREPTGSFLPPAGPNPSGAFPFGYFVGDTRNTLRLPRYSRLDLHAHRTFEWRGSRMMLFVEVTNVYNRKNWRQAPASINGLTGRADNVVEDLFPIVPSAGILVEF